MVSTVHKIISFSASVHVNLIYLKKLFAYSVEVFYNRFQHNYNLKINKLSDILFRIFLRSSCPSAL